MSSILDALKKLEDEKAEAAQTVPVDIDEEVTGRERVHPRTRRGARRGMTIPVTPATVGLAAVGLVAVIVAVSVGVSLLVARSAPTPNYLASTPAARAANMTPPETATTNDELRIENDDTTPLVIRNSQFDTAPVQETPVTPAPVTPAQPVAAEESAPVSTVAPEPPAPRASTVLAKRPAEPVDIKPARIEEDTDAVAPAIAKRPVLTERPPRAPKPTTSAAPFAPPLEVKPAEPARTRSLQDLDLYSLPILTETDKTRLGLKGLEVNMLRSPNKNRPHPSAIINMQPVYVNEIIQGTSAKLIAVDVRGIGIEIGGERFFVRK